VERIVRILHVETNLGLRPGGVERLGSALLRLDLADRVGATDVQTFRAPPFQQERDPAFGTRNLQAIAQLAGEQAGLVGEILDGDAFPLVLGGDDSVLMGCLLAMRRRGVPVCESARRLTSPRATSTDREAGRELAATRCSSRPGKQASPPVGRRLPLGIDSDSPSAARASPALSCPRRCRVAYRASWRARSPNTDAHPVLRTDARR